MSVSELYRIYEELLHKVESLELYNIAPSEVKALKQIPNPTKHAPQAFPYTLVDSKQTWNNFMDNLVRYFDYTRELGTEPQLYLDCEGRDLGCQGGALGLLQIGFNARLSAKKARAQGRKTQLKVYLLDVITLPEDLLDQFWHTLPCRHVIKVVWDGKMDACELYQGRRVSLNRILDLQVVEVLERMSDRDQPYTVHSLQGLRKQSLQYLTCAQQEAVRAIDGVVKQQHKNQESGLWCRRPLSAVMLEYASLDIFCIAATHAAFIEDGVLAAASGTYQMDRFEEKSLQYCESLQYERRDQSDKFSNHGFLPIGIFDDEEDFEDAQTLVCGGCHREILETRYHPLSVSRYGVRYCPVCYLISRRKPRR